MTRTIAEIRLDAEARLNSAMVEAVAAEVERRLAQGWQRHDLNELLAPWFRELTDWHNEAMASVDSILARRGKALH
jgi:hypothetical protein